MIEHKAKQGSDEWRSLRLGRPTASCFHMIVTPAKAELSKQSRSYAYKLICERLLNAPMDSLDGIEHIERGKELEPWAAAQYEFVTDTPTRPAGFCTTDDGLIGATPDRFIVGKNAGLEIKAKKDWLHLGYLLDGPGADYRPQVQGQMLVCEFDFVDLYSAHPRMPAAQIRTKRDNDFIAKLRDALDQFNAQMFADMERARSLGVFQAFTSGSTPEDVERAEQLRDQLRSEIDPALREA